ncbi:MAG: hypothetical protein AAF211_30355, partial [Myxococcota bacterium]
MNDTPVARADTTPSMSSPARAMLPEVDVVRRPSAVSSVSVEIDCSGLSIATSAMLSAGFDGGIFCRISVLSSTAGGISKLGRSGKLMLGSSGRFRSRSKSNRLKLKSKS